MGNQSIIINEEKFNLSDISAFYNFRTMGGTYYIYARTPGGKVVVCKSGETKEEADLKMRDIDSTFCMKDIKFAWVGGTMLNMDNVKKVGIERLTIDPSIQELQPDLIFKDFLLLPVATFNDGSTLTLGEEIVDNASRAKAETIVDEYYRQKDEHDAKKEAGQLESNAEPLSINLDTVLAETAQEQ